PYDHTSEYNDNEIGPHLRTDLENRRGEYARERSEPDTECICEGDQPRDVDTESLGQGRVLGCGTQRRAEPGAFDHEPGREAHGERNRHDPAAGDRQHHEAEIDT